MQKLEKCHLPPPSGLKSCSTIRSPTRNKSLCFTMSTNPGVPQGPNLIPLASTENITKGELVGIGLCVEPAPNCLLRVVLVRGQGDQEGVPFSHDVCPTNYAPVSSSADMLLDIVC